MKVATLSLTPELFVEFCKACKDGPPRQFIVKKNPLPDDAKIVQIGLADNGTWPHTLQLYIESESFEEVAEGEQPPELPVVWFETVYEEIAAA